MAGYYFEENNLAANRLAATFAKHFRHGKKRSCFNESRVTGFNGS